MNELYPIVRRVRRPLVVADVPPVVAGIVKPPNADAKAASANLETKRKHNDTPQQSAGTDAD